MYRANTDADDSPFIPPIPSASPSIPSSAGATTSDYSGYPSVHGDIPPHSYSPTTYSPHHPFVPSDPPNSTGSPYGYPINTPAPYFSPQLPWAPLPPRGASEHHFPGYYPGSPTFSTLPTPPVPAYPPFSNEPSVGWPLSRPRAFQSSHMPFVHEDGPQNPRFTPQTPNLTHPGSTPIIIPTVFPGSGIASSPWLTPPYHTVAGPINQMIYPAFQHPRASPGSILKVSPGSQNLENRPPAQGVQRAQTFPHAHPSEAAIYPHTSPRDVLNGPTGDLNRNFPSGTPISRPSGRPEPVPMPVPVMPMPVTYGLDSQVAVVATNPTKPDRPHLKWDMTHPTNYGDFAVEFEQHLWQPATSPATTSLFIVSEDFPWMITVDASREDVGVTCTDVINGIAECMYCLANEQDYKYVGDTSGGSIEDNYRRNRSRLQGIPSLQQGIRRLDWLGLKSAYGGIELNDALVKATLGDDAAPFTFVLLRQEILLRDDHSDSSLPPSVIYVGTPAQPLAAPLSIFIPPMPTSKTKTDRAVFKRLLRNFNRSR
ncbi:hypothetical protein CCMSSC00406_0007792 [Pleurotus cornucopiae]|uniref:Uncharacterized protein n=1 Tax=Pleurotus cornucopiae TaxID=5321 RepID=A0ACB7J5L6_PLECO|nr:hypothetical protein CCMSSC00406_0007792 [Pleurotus cornucopiae]